jgi:hypothetical protein
MMRDRLLALGGLLALLAVVAAPAASAQPGSLTFDPSPHVVAGGAKVFINGHCEANTEGFVFSHALAGQPGGTEFAGVAAIAITTDSSGKFGFGVTIATTVRPGAYTVSLRCGGGLAATETLFVDSSVLAMTGAPIGAQAALGIVFVVGGVVLIAWIRARRPQLARA